MSVREEDSKWSSTGYSLHMVVSVAIYSVLLILPAVLGLLQDFPHKDIIQELSDAILFICFMAMYLELILSGRIKALSAYAGIDLIMRIHRSVAKVLMILLLLHPFLVVRPWKSVPKAFGSLWELLFTLSMLPGIIAWILLLLLFLMAWNRNRLPLRYETWRITHGIGMLAMAALATYHVIIFGAHSNTLFITLWTVLLVLSVITVLYIHVIQPFQRGPHPYRLVSNTQIGDGLWNVTIEPVQPYEFNFIAGQFVWLSVGESAFSLNEHPFSIASCPADLPQISFIIKESGDFTSQLGKFHKGACAYIDGPHGNCTLTGRGGEGVCVIAGGAGIAPAMGILRELHSTRDPRPVRLIYGANLESELVLREEFTAISKNISFKEHLVLAKSSSGWDGLTGILDEPTLRKCLTDIERKDWLYYVWGPDVMMDSVVQTLHDWGVPQHRIVIERFDF